MPIIDCCTMVGHWPRFPADLTPTALLSAMQARGVSRAVTIHTDALFFDTSIGNRTMEEIAAQSPGLVPSAVLNPTCYPVCIEEAARALQRGTRCFHLSPAEHGYPFHPNLLALRELMQSLSGAALVTVDCSGGAAVEYSQQLGELTTCPTVLSVPAGCLGLALSVVRSVPNLYLDSSTLIAAGAVDTAVRTVGAERVLFGSRAPLMALGSALLAVQYAEIADADRAAVLEGNAARLLS